MEKTEFYYPSGDGHTEIHAIEWRGEGQIKAVLQVCHGMVEYIERYEAFASYLTDRGFVVVGHDHLGHGKSVADEEDYGYFPKESGNEYVVGDIHTLRRKTEKKYPGIPYFMLGHSMGSFLLRQYLLSYAEGLSGAVIMGTGYQPLPILMLGRGVCKCIAGIRGWRYRSKFVNSMAFGGYNKKFHPARTEMDWLTKDEKMVDAYLKNPRCTFIFTVSAYYQMFGGMKQLQKKGAIEKIPKDLPIFFVAGKEDPVGNFGDGVEKVFQKYKDCGCKDVQIKLYENDRHEILNETDRETVYTDLYSWMESRFCHCEDK